MFNKKIILILTIILVSLFAVSAVSAADNVTSEVVSVEETTDAICVEEAYEVVNTEDNQVIIGNESDFGTFDELSSLIENTPEGTTLELDKNYQNNGSGSEITISKSITIDGKGHTLDANKKSRVFYIGYSTVTLMNIVFKNGYCGSDGGAIVFGGTGNVLNCSFVNNTASDFGGAIYFDYDSIGTVENCNFVNNTALEFDGGAIYFFYSSGTVDNCNFTNHTARWGGAVEFVGTGKVTNSNFVNNHATNEGGAVYFDVDTFGNVENCSFTSNTATNGGAVYFANGGNASNCDFADNSATGYGGSVYFSSVGKIENSRFKESKYTVYGGTVINCTFNKTNFGKFSDLSYLIESTPENGVLELDADYQNDGSVSGDGISISKSLTIDGKGHTLDAKGKSRIFKLSVNNIVLKNMTFINGYSTECGGAIYNTDNFKISSCNFINCFSGDCGGAINNDGGVSNISSCNFTDCMATDGGGGVYNQYDSHYITFCSFVNCSCDNYGGAIGNGGSGERYIRSCSFVNCFSRNYGGAIDNGADCNIISCSFDNCSAGSGGAIFVNYLGVCEDISSCSFSDCSARDSGGAIYTRGDCQIISSCSFTRCSSKGNGGGICFDMDYEESKVVNCSFESCSARYGSAVYVNEESTVRIISSNFKNNKETSGGPISGGIIFDCKITDDDESGSSSKNSYGEIIPEEIISDDDGIVTLKFPKDAEGTVEVFVNGTSVVVANIVNGIANIDLSQYKGSYVLTFGYSGDKNYPAFMKNSTVTIKVIPTVIIAKDSQVIYGAGSYYIITVYESKGVLAKRISVVIKSNGKSFKNIQTNDEGIASFKITQKPGTYKLTITSLERTVTKTLKVKHLLTLKTAKVKKSAKKLVLQANLGKLNGKYLKNKKITFKFNGKKYTAKTNKKGVAKVTIKSSVLKKLKVGKKVTYQATYSKDTVKKTVKIKK